MFGITRCVERPFFITRSILVGAKKDLDKPYVGEALLCFEAFVY